VLNRIPFNSTNSLGRIAFTFFYKGIKFDKSSDTVQVSQPVFCIRDVQSNDKNQSLCFEKFCTVQLKKKNVFTRHFDGFEWKILCEIQSENVLYVGIEMQVHSSEEAVALNATGRH